jgi:ABC-type branched-subunit amino acid transport system substrate-binding protein
MRSRQSIGTSARSQRRLVRGIAAASVVALALAACGDAADDTADGDIATDVGVDLDEQVVTIGALNDESGPAAQIGEPFAIGKRMLVEQVNAGDLDILPEGWTVELVERDHGYNPQESVQAFQEIADQVLYFATSFGTPPTLPLVEDATQREITLFPASLESGLAENEYTPPIGSPYKVEAHQAVDWAVEDGGDDLAFAIIYQGDDYGQDGLEGAREAAEHHGIDIVAEVEVAPGEPDVTGPVTQVSEAGATHVLLTTLPSATGPILGTAAGQEFFPVWLGNTPAWIDAFFNEEVLPSAVYQNFRWVTGLTIWGDDVAGMDNFLAAYEEYGSDLHPPDFYLIASYAQGKLGLEAVARALDAGDVTRAGYHEALRTIEGYDADGLFPEAIDLDQVPYATTSDTRVLAPGEDLESWEVLRDFSTPDSWEGL